MYILTKKSIPDKRNRTKFDIGRRRDKCPQGIVSPNWTIFLTEYHTKPPLSKTTRLDTSPSDPSPLDTSPTHWAPLQWTSKNEILAGICPVTNGTKRMHCGDYPGGHIDCTFLQKNRYPINETGQNSISAEGGISVHRVSFHQIGPFS